MKASMCSLSCLTEVKDAPLEGLPVQDREPDFHLVKPGSARRREVEAHIWVPLEPTVVARLVGTEVIEHDVDGRVRPSGDDAVHEVEELDAPPALLVRRRHLAGGDLEGGKQPLEVPLRL